MPVAGSVVPQSAPTLRIWPAHTISGLKDYMRCKGEDLIDAAR